MPRYINTDILSKIVFDKWQECDELKQVIPAIRRAIMAASFDEVDTIKHGKWKPLDRTWGRSIYCCTYCGESEDVPTEMGKVIWKYCPNCGARMGGEE